MKLLTTTRTLSVLRSVPSANYSDRAYAPFGYHKKGSGRPLGFNGQIIEEFDAYFLGQGYRAYKPILMRFASPDSLGPFEAGGINCYSYCNADPVNRSDPTGHVSVLSRLIGNPKILGMTAGALGLVAGGTAAGYFAGGPSSEDRRGLLYASIALGLLAGAVGGGALRAQIAKSRAARLELPKQSVLLGYHGTAEGGKLSKSGFFRPGELYLTNSVGNARHYAGPKGRVFGAYVNDADLPMMSARNLPKLNSSSAVIEMPLNIHAKKLVRAREVVSGPSVDLDNSFLSFGRTNQQYQMDLIAKMRGLRG